jgi:hypothetical protein
MKKLTLISLLPILLLASQNFVRAQSPTSPVVAEQRQLVYQIQPDGSKIVTQQQIGAFYRSSSGATMNSMGQHSTFIDEQGNAYEISHRTKTVEFVQHNPPMDFSRLKGKPHETVNGYDCAVSSSTTLVNGKPESSAYWHIPTGLLIKFESTKGNMQTVRELYDIKFVEPDPSLVRIPNGYSF